MILLNGKLEYCKALNVSTTFFDKKRLDIASECKPFNMISVFLFCPCSID